MTICIDIQGWYLSRYMLSNDTFIYTRDRIVDLHVHAQNLEKKEYIRQYTYLGGNRWFSI